MKKLFIFYDNFCHNCTKLAKFVKRWDNLNLIVAKKLRDNLHIDKLNVDLATKKMASQLR